MESLDRQVDGRARALTWPRQPLQSWEPSPSGMQPSPDLGTIFCLSSGGGSLQLSSRLLICIHSHVSLCVLAQSMSNQFGSISQSRCSSISETIKRNGRTPELHTHFLTHTSISGSIRPCLQPVEVVHIHMCCGQDEWFPPQCQDPQTDSQNIQWCGGPGSFCCMIMVGIIWLEGVTSTWIRWVMRWVSDVNGFFYKAKSNWAPPEMVLHWPGWSLGGSPPGHHPTRTWQFSLGACKKFIPKIIHKQRSNRDFHRKLLNRLPLQLHNPYLMNSNSTHIFCYKMKLLSYNCQFSRWWSSD